MSPEPFVENLFGQHRDDTGVAVAGPFADQILDLVWPVASIRWTAAATPDAGFVPADGAPISRTVYARLFAKIGTTYGAGDGSTTFNVPNLKGKVSVGIDAADAAFDALGETGGSKTSTAAHSHDLASHTHGLATHDHSLSSHTHGLATHTHTGGAHAHGGGTGVHAHSGATAGPANGTVYSTSDEAHAHAGGAGQVAESPSAMAGVAFGADHVHNFSTSTVGQANTSESPETGGANSVGPAAVPSTNTSGGTQNVGAAQAPSSNASGASSAAATNGNLPPYVVLTPTIRY